MATAPVVLSLALVKLKVDADANREVSHATTSVNGVKYAIVRGVNEKGQRYLDQYDLESKTHEKRPLQGGPDATVAMSDAGLLAITSAGKMQVFNMSARQVVSTAQLPALANGEPNSVKFWKFTSAQTLVMYGSDSQVYVWSIATANVAPTPAFKLQDALVQAGQVVDIQVSDDQQWFTAVVRAPHSDAKQHVQMHSVARGVSSVQEASAAAVYDYASKSCTVMALAAKGPNGYRLLVAELATTPGAPKFERLALELPSDSSHSMPVCILRQGLDPNILTLVTEQGHVHVANTETRAWIAHGKLPGDETIFTGATSPGFNHLVVISTQGTVFAVTTRGGNIPQPVPTSTTPTPSPSPAVASSSAPSTPPPAATGSPTTTVKEAFSELSLQSIVEPRKPLTPVEEFFSVYPPEALALYKSDRPKFLPYFKEKGLSLNWQGLIIADKDMSVASKLAFGMALAHMELASRGAVVIFFEKMGYLSDSHTKVNYMLDLLAHSNSPADADLQTDAIVLGLDVNPKVVVDNVVSRRWTYFNVDRVSEAALQREQWDLVWLLATSFEQRIQLLTMHSLSINPNQILQWYNTLPADGCLEVLETLYTARATAALSWERIAAPPNDRLAPHLDLTVSPPFQTLRVKIASAANAALWERYIKLTVDFGESKELSRILLQYSNDKAINEMAEAAVKKAAAESSLTAALPLLILAERNNKIEDLVSYHIARASAESFLIPYATVIQPQNAARVIALVAQKDTSNSSYLLNQLLTACATTEVLTTANLWLAAQQTNTAAKIATALASLVEAAPNVPLLVAYNVKFNSSS